MEINTSLEIQEQVLPILPQTWHYRLAEWISRLFSPPLIAAVGLMVIFLTQPNRSSAGWAFLTLTLIILAPALFLVYLHRSGEITDLDVYIRQQRIRPYLLSIGCSAFTFALLYIARAPLPLQIFAAAALLETGGLFLVNLKWKISAHTAAIAGFSTLGLLLGGMAALPLFMAIPLVAWSRVHLKRHTLYQTIAGSLWGMVSFTLAFYLLG